MPLSAVQDFETGSLDAGYLRRNIAFGFGSCVLDDDYLD